MTTDAERIARLEAYTTHITTTLERVEEKLDKSLERHDASEKKLSQYENQLTGARWVFSILIAIGAFFGFKFGVITVGK